MTKTRESQLMHNEADKGVCNPNKAGTNPRFALPDPSSDVLQVLNKRKKALLEEFARLVGLSDLK
jgi:hypothetical protein